MPRSMERSELVRRLILNEIGDDYENVDQIILPQVAKIGERCGLTIMRPEVVQALTELVEGGLAKAYLLSPWPGESRELEGMPPGDAVEEDFETYFLSTREGMELHLSDDSWWPLGDDEYIEPPPPHVRPVGPPKRNKA